MENLLRDAAFQVLTTREETPVGRQRPYVDLDKARMHDLKRRFPTVEAHEVEEAYRLAQALLAAAIEMADLNRGPRNDGTGPAFDIETLAKRCPGFSQASYELALNEGFLLTR